MSTVSTSINSSSTFFLSDHYRKYIHKTATEKQSMGVLFVSSFVMGGASILVALTFIGVTSDLDVGWALSSVFSDGILGLFLFAFVLKKASGKAASPEKEIKVIRRVATD